MPYQNNNNNLCVSDFQSGFQFWLEIMKFIRNVENIEESS